MGARGRRSRKSRVAVPGDAATDALQGGPSVGGCSEVAEGAGTSKAATRAARRLTPALPEVLAAVESLYEDELKPFGRILRKRIAERAPVEASASPSEVPDVDIAHLRAVCEASEVLRVEAEEGGDWSAVFVGRPLAFVDVYDLEDVYPSSLWEEASAYFEGLGPEEMLLPGGRYSCAQALLARCLPFLERFSLGQVCRFVQLAISKKKVLGYLNGAVVPYSRSQSMVKERCAVWQQPCTDANAETSGLPLATWDVARACLREILEAAATLQGPGSVPLSNVKRLFRSRFHVELSETMLGHSKLSDLLQDARFADVCAVRLEGHGYTVVQQTRPHGASPISLADRLPPPTSSPSSAGRLPEADARASPTHQDLLPNEPLRFDVEDPLVLAGGARRSLAVEAWISPQSPAQQLAAPAPWPSRRGLHWPSVGLSPSAGLSPGSALSPFALSKEGRVGRHVRNTFIHAAAPPPTPPPGARGRSKSLPRDFYSERSTWEAACNALTFFPRPLLRKGSGSAESAAGSLAAGGVSTSTGTTLAPPSPELTSPQQFRSLSGELRSPTMEDAPMKVPLRRAPPSKDSTPVGVQLLAAFNAVGGREHGAGIVPRTLSDSLGCLLDRELAGDTGRTSDSEPQRRVLFCPDEPLCLEDAGYSDEQPSPAEPPRSERCPTPPGPPRAPPPGLPTLLAPKWGGLSPTVLCKEGRTGSTTQSPNKRNTLHRSAAAPRAAQRSQSLPKDVGSCKSPSEAESPLTTRASRPVQSPQSVARPPQSPATSVASPQPGNYGLWPGRWLWPGASPQRVLHLADHV